ncbi:MAG TPA: NAD(+)/NADH kinase [Bryobacteraceae bacterium]|nr:NAD(+)/NADH kinase [Bryobacteraceae bacterium]
MQTAIKTIGIFSKPGVRQARTLVPELFAWLAERGIQVRCDEHTAAYAGLKNGLPRPEVPDGCQLMVVLGGDGTLLSAARAIGGRDVPLFAVNLGGLGFLTAITVDDLYAELERALRNEHRIARRRMLHCELWRDEKMVAQYEALNDVVLTKASLARVIDMLAFVDNHFVCSYKADGLIISTPTGSTAYSLSAGGPIVFPSVSALCITPICPHMLTNRPVIVPDDSIIQLTLRDGRETAYLTVDGQVGEPLEPSDRVICRRSEKTLHLIRPPKMLFFDVLREKLSWGER